MPEWKSLFSTPKKAAVSIACVLVILVTAGVCIAYAAGAFQPIGGELPGESEQPSQPGETAIGGEAAQGFAFADAGVDPVDATAVSAKYARWEGQFVYEVEFIAGGTEYEYKINATDGSVVKKETRTVKGPEDSAPAVQGISLEEAREIALADAGLAREQVTFTQAELEEENGVPVYEFEFFAGNVEYDYEINASTGAVYSKGVTTYVGQGQGSGGVVPPSAPVPSAPAVESTPPSSAPPVQSASQPPAGEPSGGIAPPSSAVSPPSSGITPPGKSAAGQLPTQIDADAAKAAALSHAGFSAGEVVFSKVKLDYEDGAVVYEVEFYKDGMEYEYEINGATGDVVEFSWEPWD